MRVERLAHMYSQVRLVLRKLPLHKNLYTMRTRPCFTDIKDIQSSFHSKTRRTNSGREVRKEFVVFVSFRDDGCAHAW